MLKQGFQLLTVQMAVVALFTSLFHSLSLPSPAASPPSASTSPSLVTSRTSQQQQDDDDLALITSTLPYLTKHASSRIAAVRTVASSSLAAFRLLLRAYDRRRDGSASAHERATPFDDLVGQVGRTIERAELAGLDPLVAAEAELDGHEGFVDPAAVLGGGTGGGGESGGSLFGRGGGGAEKETLAWEGSYSLCVSFLLALSRSRSKGTRADDAVRRSQLARPARPRRQLRPRRPRGPRVRPSLSSPCPLAVADVLPILHRAGTPTRPSRGTRARRLGSLRRSARSRSVLYSADLHCSIAARFSRSS